MESFEQSTGVSESLHACVCSRTSHVPYGPTAASFVSTMTGTQEERKKNVKNARTEEKDDALLLQQRKSSLFDFFVSPPAQLFANRRSMLVLISLSSS